MEKFMEKVKNFFSNKIYLVSTIVVGIILVILIIVLFFNKNKEGFLLNSIYDVYPEEVRNLYKNMVEVSCYGDLHLDISLDDDEVLLNDMKYSNLIDYMFSYLDKTDKLSNEFSVDLINETADKLFADKINLTDYIDNYVYGEYKYSLADGIITREKSACNSDYNYVSQLYGYSYNKEILSVDVNIGYLKNDVLYNLSNEKLGKYDGDVRSLGDLFLTSSYYRFNYILDGRKYKLKSVEWNVRY